MVTLDKTLDQVMKLDFASREILLEVLSKRSMEERRKTLASNAKKARSNYKKGKSKPLSIADTLRQINSI